MLVSLKLVTDPFRLIFLKKFMPYIPHLLFRKLFIRFFCNLSEVLRHSLLLYCNLLDFTFYPRIKNSYTKWGNIIINQIKIAFFPQNPEDLKIVKVRWFYIKSLKIQPVKSFSAYLHKICEFFFFYFESNSAHSYLK